MAIKVTVKVEGMAALRDALSELPKATSKNVMRRVLNKRAAPIAEKADSLVPVDRGDLKKSIRVGTVLSPRARRAHQRPGPLAVEVLVGPGPHPQAHLQEFGTQHHGAQPYMRPAWDASKDTLLTDIGKDIAEEIEKARKRLARKAAKGK